VRIFEKDELLAMGTIVDSRGYLVTKASEIEGHKNLICRFSDGGRLKAKLVNTSAQHDLAMLKVNATNLAAIHFDPAVNLEVGSIVATPSLEEKPVAIGIVSSTASEVGSDAVLGIRMSESPQGPLITEVLPGSAAEIAGIKPMDTIVSINDQPVERMRDAVDMIGQHLPGHSVRFLVERGDEQIEYTATLGRFADLDKENGDFQGYLGGALSHRRSGFPLVFQHDTFLLPSHCGSPVVDLQGRVIGLNIARAERISSYALPASVVIDLVKELKPQTVETSNVLSKGKRSK
jgi:serine protease Do